jgi:GNAT superfamily N-acetyltransferase
VLEIRCATAADAAEIARLNQVFNHAADPPEVYAARMQDPRCVDRPVLALMGERVVGLVNLRLVPSLFHAGAYAELSEVLVEEEQRRKGIGMAMIQFAERLALENGARQMIIQTDFYNHAAQQLYRAAGYVHYDISLCKPLV